MTTLLFTSRSRRYVVGTHCWPEVASVLLGLGGLDVGSDRGAMASIGVILILSVVIRTGWNAAVLLHGLGHTLLIAAVDRNGKALNIDNIAEHQNLLMLARSLMPFQWIGGPWTWGHALPWVHAGDPAAWKLRIKATGGLVLNGVAVAGALAAIQSPEFNLAQHTGLLPFWLSSSMVGSVLASNGMLLACSRTDWAALLTGRADCFYCGNFGFIAERDTISANELLSQRGLERFRTMGHETEVRGEQAGGGLVLACDRAGYIRFVGEKLVNTKRQNLTLHLESAFARKRRQAVRAGYRPLNSCITAAWHYRFGTSGPPSVLETHWHEWCPARVDRIWEQHDGLWSVTEKNINHRITHNGDFEGFRLFKRVVDYETLGLWLERVLHVANKTLGDSPKIAGMLDILICKGNWYSAVRLGYQMAIAQDFSAAFGGMTPTRTAPQTAPSRSTLEHWASIFETCFVDFAQTYSERGWSDDKLRRQQMQRRIHDNLSRDSCLSMNGADRLWNFIDETVHAFLHNNPEQASRLFLTQARGSFGLITLSTLTPDQVVLGCLGQPLSAGFDPEDRVSFYASEPASIDATLALRPQAFRIDLNQNSGEVAVLTSTDLRVYSLSDMRNLSADELLGRKILYKKNPHLQPSHPSAEARRDPVAADLRDIPWMLHAIKDDWINPSSLNRQSADYFINILIAKAHHLQDKQALLKKVGLDPSLAKSSHVDILVTGVENSLWVGAQFAKDLASVFPLLTIKTLSSNQVLQSLQYDFDGLGLARQTVVLAISQSGQTFCTRQVMEACDLLVREDVIREVFVLTGEPTSFVGSSMMQSACAGEPFSRRLFNSGGGRRTAEPATASVAALHHTLTELLFCLCRQIQLAFPDQHPLGMTLSSTSLLVLEGMEDHLFLQSVVNIIGADCKREKKPTRLYRQIVAGGRHWGFHVLEHPIAWAIQALYVAITVGWAIPFGHTIPLMQTVWKALIDAFGLNSDWLLIQVLSGALAMADLGIYIFGPWIWTIGLRLAQGRQLLARAGKRTLVIGETAWVHQILSNFVSKLFSLSYGVTSLEVQAANPQDDLVHSYAHRIVRGTLLFLGIPDGRCSEQQHSEETAALMAGRQAHGIQHLKTGPEILLVGSNPSIGTKGFAEGIVLPSPVHKACEEFGTDRQGDKIMESLRESRFGSFRRLLASYIFFWSMAQTVASLPLLKYEFWKSQSRTKVMTTAAPVSAAKLDRPEPDEVSVLHLPVYANRDQS
jgi:hypothetical protein